MLNVLSRFLHPPAARYKLFSNRDILRLAGPLFVEQLLFMFVGTIDILMVASLGEASISAVSLVDMFNNFIASVFFALATGGAVVFSQYIGAGNIVRAREGAKQLLAVVLAAGVGIAALCMIFLPEIVRGLFGSLEQDVHEATMSYFRITLLALPLISVYGGCAALFRSMNRTKVTMYISLGSNVINFAGNAVFIFGFNWGVSGAAFATVLSRLFSMTVILWLLSDRTRKIHVDFRTGFRIRWELVKKILYIGIPGGIENGIFQFGRIVVLSLIATYGTREIAANAVANTVDHLGCILGGTFSLATITVIGQAAGAGDIGQIRYYVRKMTIWAWVAHFSWNVLLFLFTPLLLLCFQKIDAETRHLALILILIHNGLGMFFWTFSFTFPNALRSLNDVRWPMFISIASMLIVRIGGSYVLAPLLHSGVLAVWIVMILDWFVRLTGFVLRYRSGAWMKLISAPSEK